MLDCLVIALFVVLVAFFSGSETGFYCISRLRLRFRIESGWPGAGALGKLTADPKLAVSSMLIGTNLGIYAATVLCAKQLVDLGADQRADIYSSLIMAPVLLIFAEIIPKSLFQRRPDALMYRMAWLLNAFRIVFSPVLLLLLWMNRLARAVAGGRASRDRPAVTDERFRFFLSEGAAVGVLSPYQRAMADNILRVKSVNVSTAMVPLEEVIMIPDGASAQELSALLRDHGFSRIPVYSAGRTDISGVINVIDLLAARQPPDSLAQLSRPPHRVADTMSVAEALYSLQQARQQMAVVTGKDDAAVGIVTVKDLVEEIVGELRAW